MTFTEAAAHVLRLVGKPLHYKEITDVAIAGSGRDVHVAVAGGPAGAFIYALLPYGGGFAIREITRP